MASKSSMGSIWSRDVKYANSGDNSDLKGYENKVP